MHELVLDFHGMLVRTRAADPGAAWVLEELKGDLGYFEAQAPASSPAYAGMTLSLGRFRFPLPEPRLFMSRLFETRLFKTRMCDGAYGLGGTRRCDYGDGAWIEARNRPKHREFKVAAPSREALHEIAYMAVLSAAGEALDSQGYHRVHALGVERLGDSGLVLLPQGGGKSAMASLLLSRDPEVRLYSDEIPLLRGGELHPFPIRMALLPEVAEALGLEASARRLKRRRFPEKALYPIPPERVALPAPCRFVMTGRFVRGEPRIRVGKTREIVPGLLQSLVVGLGVPQMAEHMLRLDAVPGLARISLSRLRAAVSIARSAETFVFEIGPDAEKNAEALLGFLEERAFER